MNDMSPLVSKMSHFAKNEGFNASSLEGVGVYKSSVSLQVTCDLYQAFICLVGQGEKICSVGDASFRYCTGDLFINFLPLPVDSEIVSSSVDKPFLSIALGINLAKLAEITLRIDQASTSTGAGKCEPSSCVVVGKVEPDLLDAFDRLLKVAYCEMDAKMLGESIIDEIYYRILTSEQGDNLRRLLSQHGQIQPISKVVNHIHSNIERTIKINELSNIANMSNTSFFNAFKGLMHVSPMQYIKASKLQKAQSLIKQGEQASSVSYRVGYNSFSQFSREYKRLFGHPPSQTV